MNRSFLPFLCIPASVADAVAVNPNGIKTLLANGGRVSPSIGGTEMGTPPPPTTQKIGLFPLCPPPPLF